MPAVLTVLLAIVAIALTACGSSAPGTDGGSTATAGDSSESASSGSFPVTISHAFGETTIPAQPKRVATVSWVNADVALALGVVPVGMAADEWGGNANESTPWKDAALEKAGAAIGTPNAPVQYSEADGINFTEIAKTQPDVILAAYSGLSQEDYDKLSKIAPVVAYPDAPWGTSWQDATTMIAEALGKEQQAKDLVASTEQTLADKAAQYPQLKDKTFIFGNLEPGKSDGISIYTALDNRPKLLSELGMKQAPVVEANTSDKTAFYFPWSAERANELDSDIFVTWVPDAATADAITTDPLLGQIPAVRSGALVTDSDNTLTLAFSASSPLSLPWALDQFLPKLAAAADKAQ